MKSSLLSLLVIFGLSATLLSCGGEVAKSSFSSPSEGGGDGDDDGSGGGEVSNEAMLLNVRALDFPTTTTLHQFYNRNAACRISPSDATTQMKCLLNVRELDFFTGGIKLEFNVPKSMCAHVTWTPYYYYNRPAGLGSQVIEITRQVNGSGNCTIDGNPGVYNAAAKSCTWNEGTADMTGKIKCAYNHSPAGPNCCQGSYIFTTTQITAADPEVQTSSGDWGGSAALCVSSPAQYEKSGWQVSEGEKFPLTTYSPGDRGVNKYFTIAPPIMLKGASSNKYGANFFDWASYASGAFNPVPAAPSLGLTTDFSGNPFDDELLPHPTYKFVCYDESEEAKHTIDLYINEWDSNAEFAKYIAGQSATPISTGSCGPVPSACNDRFDWKASTNLTPFPSENTTYDPAKEDNTDAE